MQPSQHSNRIGCVNYAERYSNLKIVLPTICKAHTAKSVPINVIRVVHGKLIWNEWLIWISVSFTQFLLFWRFKVRHYLNMHRRLRHNNRQFNCPKCAKSFQSKQSLGMHLERHAGTVVKPYVCDVCGFAFQIKSRLKVFIAIFKQKSQIIDIW